MPPPWLSASSTKDNFPNPPNDNKGMRKNRIHYLNHVTPAWISQKHAVCGAMESAPYWRVNFVRKIENVTCKKCLNKLALRVGLVKGTPAGVISDKTKESKYAR